jgi:hypothetical protein
MSVKSKLWRATPEHVMLVAFIAVGNVFLIDPAINNYPGAARLFPQATAAIIVAGSILLLTQNHLPEPLRAFVAESVNVTESTDAESAPTDDQSEADTTHQQRTLGAAYGIEINDTLFMVAISGVYLVAGYAVGLLYVTPLFVLVYTTWFRVPWYIGIGLAARSSAVVLGFAEFLFMPFDRGEIFFTDLEVTL